MNPILILTMNNLDLTKKCVESVREQDIDTEIWIVDNGSTDGTPLWAFDNDILLKENESNAGVSAGWNYGLGAIFDDKEFETPWEQNHVLVLNNDAIIPPWFYSELLSYDVPFVTGVAIDQMPTVKPEKMPLNPHPDFSAFLIRRQAWEKVGPFDERMKIYASDTDYHVRAHRLGVDLWKANVPYFHVNSQTLKRASAEDRAKIEAQANMDRAVFRDLYGCLPGTPEYQKLFEKEG